MPENGDCQGGSSITGQHLGAGFERDRRQRLYGILSDSTLTRDEKLRRLLEFGCEQLGVENGHVVEIDRGTGRHEIEWANGSDLARAGVISNLQETFCRKTIETDGVLTIYDATAGEWADDPAVQAWSIGCYVGNKLVVDGELYGTMCFVDETPREEPFTRDDRSFVGVLGQAASQLLERAAYERSLHRHQAEFQLFVEEVSDYAMFLLDPDGNVATWNKGARFLKQYREREIIGEHFSRFYTADDRAEGLPDRLLEQARRTGRVEDEGWRVRKDGTQFWALVSITALYDERGDLRGFGKVTRDITERRAVERELRREQEFTERALDTLDDLFFVLTPDGAIDRVNERAVEVSGYSEDELQGMEPQALFVPDDRDAIADAVQDVLETGQTRVQATLVTKADERRHFEFRATRLLDDDGEVTGIVGIGRDVTDERIYRKRLEVAQRVLRHNLRNELNALRGWAELLVEAEGDAPREPANWVLDIVDRLIDLSEKTYTLTDLDALPEEEQTVVDVADQLPRIVDRFRGDYPAVTIDVDLPTADRLAVPSGQHFEIALRNAIENAIKHNPSDEPWVGIEVERRGNGICVHVHDDGPGVPEEERRVIEAGTETPLRHGSGVGLWLTLWCVTTIGGTLSFEEREPRGSTLTLTLPLVEDQ